MLTSVSVRISQLIPFKYPNFGKLFLGQFISNIGSQFSYIALQFLIFDLTGNIYAMAILAIAEAIPMILIGPWAGVIIDRIDRKYAMAFANLAQAVIIFLIPITKFFGNRVWWIIGLAFINSISARFFFPARGASIPKLIDDKNDLFAANSLSAGIYQVSVLIGPMLAGLIIGIGGYDIPFIIDALSFIFSAICIFWINKSLKAERGLKQKPLQDLIMGGRFVISFQPIFYLLFVFSILMFAGGASMILIIPHLEINFGLVQQGDRELIFGIMSSFSALLGIIIAFILSRKRRLGNPISLITMTMLLAGVLLIGFGFAEDLIMLTLTWVGFGAIEVFIAIPLQTIAQETVPDELRGKIFSFINLSMTIFQILGMGAISILASSPLGIRNSLKVNGIILIIFFGFGLFWLRNRRLEALADTKREEYYKKHSIKNRN
ncbi:MAG: MFS transporter [Candidatus Hodarchaeota archaeon]